MSIKTKPFDAKTCCQFNTILDGPTPQPEEITMFARRTLHQKLKRKGKEVKKRHTKE